jgi:simple sugar transport system ATP-binding protein
MKGRIKMPSKELVVDTMPVVEMRAISKRFPGVLANDAVDFTCYAGEVHALLGENGAGKSTLMKILSGLYHPDGGEILIGGRPVRISSPADALSMGIGMVHQELRLAQSLSVAENITMGSENFGFFYSKEKKVEIVQRFSEQIGLEIEPSATVWQLSVGEQQRVEILKILFRGVRLIVLDEPTALLTPQESENLFEYLRTITDRGCAIAFVTHKLEEVMAVADRITILRQGRTESSMSREGTSTQALARLMIGETITAESGYSDCQSGETLLELENVHALGDLKRNALNGVSLTVSRGEILGLAGVAGNGQRELAEVIAGLRSITKGSARLAEEDLDGLTPIEIIRRGVAYIPEDRLGVGVVPDMSVSENLILRDFYQHRFSGKMFIKKKPLNDYCADLVKNFGIKTHDIHQPVRMLSGGNIQRVILARELSRNPILLLAVNPTRGLDIGATGFIHRLLIEQKNKGLGILLVSEDLDELFELSDRLAVIYQGQIKGVVTPNREFIEEIGLMMGGAA